MKKNKINKQKMSILVNEYSKLMNEYPEIVISSIGEEKLPLKQSHEDPCRKIDPIISDEDLERLENRIKIIRDKIDNINK